MDIFSNLKHYLQIKLFIIMSYIH